MYDDTRHMNAADEALLSESQSSLGKVIGDSVGEGTAEVAVLDFPRHNNAGDTLIWSGEIAQLGRLGLGVSYVADIGRYDQRALEIRLPDGPILLHGGGNFGDLWPQFQDERELVVRRNPNRRIVCLPQSIRFESLTRARLANSVLASHGGVIVLARDQLSLRRAQEQLPDVDVRYCFDAALGNTPMQAIDPPSIDVFVVQRIDQESAGKIRGFEKFDHKIGDWGLRGGARAAWAANRAPLALYKRLPQALRPTLQGLVDGRYAQFVNLNLESARRLVSTGKVLVTDRLHAHVLACLLGIPNVVVDNSYGKIKPIFDEYTGAFSTAHYAGNAEEVEGALTNLLSEL